LSDGSFGKLFAYDDCYRCPLAGQAEHTEQCFMAKYKNTVVQIMIVVIIRTLWNYQSDAKGFLGLFNAQLYA